MSLVHALLPPADLHHAFCGDYPKRVMLNILHACDACIYVPLHISCRESPATDIPSSSHHLASSMVLRPRTRLGPKWNCRWRLERRAQIVVRLEEIRPLYRCQALMCVLQSVEAMWRIGRCCFHGRRDLVPDQICGNMMT